MRNGLTPRFGAKHISCGARFGEQSSTVNHTKFDHDAHRGRPSATATHKVSYRLAIACKRVSSMGDYDIQERT